YRKKNAREANLNGLSNTHAPKRFQRLRYSLQKHACAGRRSSTWSANELTLRMALSRSTTRRTAKLDTYHSRLLRKTHCASGWPENLYAAASLISHLAP